MAVPAVYPDASSVEHGRLRVGGWDYILGDEGSGYSIGMRVLRAVASAHDRRTPPTRLSGAVFDAFGARRFEDLLGVIYNGEVTPQRSFGYDTLVIAVAWSLLWRSRAGG